VAEGDLVADLVADLVVTRKTFRPPRAGYVMGPQSPGQPGA
jgi:hypothetical protein